MSSPRHGQLGQAAIETAIVLPLFLAATLGLVQLALLQHARLLTEYAAFQAARVGIVWNGDPSRMQDAAIFALAPTACPTRVPGAAALCGAGGAGDRWAHQVAGVAALQALSSQGEAAFPGVHVHLLNPWWPKHGEVFDVGPDREELDFDRTDDRAREANVLTIQVQYWFELKIPFADWVIWHAWVASLAGRSATGSIADPGVVRRGEDGRSILASERELPFAASAARMGGAYRDDEFNRGGDYRSIRDDSLRAMLAAGLAPLNRQRRGYFIPIVAHHSMRMQSNFHARFIRGCSCSEGRGCTSTCKAW